MTDTSIRFGIDVGGTFTDFALSMPSGVKFLKLPTSTRTPEKTILEGVKRMLEENNLGASDVDGIVHGTTLATNAIISRKGARTALLTTSGFRDVLEMGDEGRFDKYDVNIIKPDPLVPRWWRYTVDERLAANGDVLLDLDENALDGISEQLKTDGIESLAICFLHAHTDGQHERKARERIRGHLPDLPISLSSEISPEIGEYERFSTTAANAYVQPLIGDYLNRLATGLKATGLTAPVFMFLSNGGLCDLETARQAPIRLVESGPAGGAVFAGALAKQLEEDEILAFDMGGTTAKICFIDGGVPRRASSFEMAREHMHREGSGLPARIPVVDLVEIGAGGGSIAKVDGLGRLRVGPESAGSNPGPACYGRGGRNAAVTDANIALGRLASQDFEGSGLAVTAAWAKTAIGREIGDRLKLDPLASAAAISAVVEEQMASAAREHAREKGIDIRSRTLVAFGGSAPLHAANMANRLGIDRIIVPSAAGVGSAIGFLQAQAVFEISRSLAADTDSFDPAPFNQGFAAIREEAVAAVEAAAPGKHQEARRTIFMRYKGQGNSLAVDIDDAGLTADAGQMLRELFQDRYRQSYKRALEGVSVECVGIGVRVSAGGDVINAGSASGVRPPAITGRPRVFDLEQRTQIPYSVIFRDDLQPETTFRGPGLIKDYGTTIVVPRGFIANRSSAGHVIIIRVSAGPAGGIA